jgi:site-specific DNA recombinase
VRVSTSAQETDGTAMQTQEDACRRYCEERGWAVDEMLIYREAYSGAKLWERPALSDLRAEMRTGRFTAIVFYAVDRLSREQNHLGLLVSECEHQDVRLACVTVDWDESPLGKFLRSATAFAAELERAKTYERTARGKRQRVKDGKPLGGKRPCYGYQWNADHTAYVEHPEEAPIVRHIFHELAQGRSLHAVAEELTRTQVPIPWPIPGNHHTWYHSTVQRIARNERYYQPAAYRHEVTWVTGKDSKTGSVSAIAQCVSRRGPSGSSSLRVPSHH